MEQADKLVLKLVQILTQTGPFTCTIHCLYLYVLQTSVDTLPYLYVLQTSVDTLPHLYVLQTSVDTLPYLYVLLENVEHCGGEPEQAANMHMNRLSFMLKWLAESVVYARHLPEVISIRRV